MGLSLCNLGHLVIYNKWCKSVLFINVVIYVLKVNVVVSSIIETTGVSKYFRL